MDKECKELLEAIEKTLKGMKGIKQTIPTKQAKYWNFVSGQINGLEIAEGMLKDICEIGD